MAPPPIALYTDFGFDGPYVGQMKAAINREAPDVTIIDLMHDVPSHDVRSAAYLLAALCREFETDTVFVAVIDPEVGSDQREPVVLKAEGRWFVGPGNGLFSVVAAQSASVKAWTITWRPERLSASFHGRDIFAPVAGRIARGQRYPGRPCEIATAIKFDWPLDLAQVIYIDRFGNAMTGVRAKTLSPQDTVLINGQTLPRAGTFTEVPEGVAMWYENSNGLVEVAVNRGRAESALGLTVGSAVSIERG